MKYLLDTNVISEIIRLQPNPQVIAWINSIHTKEFALSALSIGELRKGISKLSEGAKKTRLIQWLETDLMLEFEGRIIAVDAIIADKWGYLCGISSNPLPIIDSLLAASALVFNLKLVTRNVKDFEKILGLELINPWT
jgi:hypothetical protein